jgi:hypothetical protein
MACVRKGRRALPAPLRGPYGFLDPPRALRRGEAVGTGNTSQISTRRWQVEQGMGGRLEIPIGWFGYYRRRRSLQVSACKRRTAARRLVDDGDVRGS